MAGKRGVAGDKAGACPAHMGTGASGVVCPRPGFLWNILAGGPYRAEARPICLLLAQVGNPSGVPSSPLYISHAALSPHSWLTEGSWAGEMMTQNPAAAPSRSETVVSQTHRSFKCSFLKTLSYLFFSLKQPDEVNVIIVPILLVSKLRVREVK